jgi:DNA polymerase (family 10)
LPVHNAEIAEIFNQIADLLEIEGANQFRVRAYRNAARTIGGLPRSVADMIEEGRDLTELPGIGEDLAGKIGEIVETGSLAQLEEIKRRTPPELADLLKISGLGPKRVQALREGLGIISREDLEKAARQGKIQQLDGFGEKIEQEILKDIERAKGEEERTLLMVAEQIAEPLVDYLREGGRVEDVIVAGSYRRRKETVGDLDILATSEEGAKAIERFVEYEDVEEVISEGKTRSTVVLRSGMQVDLRVVPRDSYGAALFYFTGSKSHNIALRNMALEQDLKINEYGVFKGEDQIAGETEEEIYGVFDLPYIPPELRENRGELEAASKGQLPQIITLEDLRGDLQSHTKDSDGNASLKEMAQAAQDRGYEYFGLVQKQLRTFHRENMGKNADLILNSYFAITDHSKYVAVTQGLDAEGLARQIEEIDRLNGELDGIVLLKGVEVDILEDGSLDLADDILKKLDLTICSIHSKFGLSREKQTERIIRAMDNPYFNILAHPTGRLIGERAPYDVDMERVMEAARERGCFLEINAQPKRLDLDDVYCKMAKEMGVKVSISTDAQTVNELDYLRFGVGQARRGWLEAEDVLNTRSWKELKKLLKRS